MYDFEYEDHALNGLIALDQDHLFSVISTLHENVHGTIPTYMREWNNEKLVDWFSSSFRYNPHTDKWQCISIAIH